MEWKIDIEGKPNQRILLIFKPEKEILVIIGQYKPHNKEWANFSEDGCSINSDLDKIQEKIVEVYDLMKKRINVYEDINSAFSLIKKIEIKEEPEDNK